MDPVMDLSLDSFGLFRFNDGTTVGLSGDRLNTDDGLDLYCRNDPDTIRQNVNNGASVNDIRIIIRFNRSFLWICCRKRDIEKLKLGLELGGNPNLMEPFGIYKDRNSVELIKTMMKPILHIAIDTFFVQGVKLLLENGADIYLKATNRRNAVYHARRVYEYCNIEKTKPCKCHEDRYACEPCDSKKIYEMIRNHELKHITLFRIMIHKTHILSQHFK